MKKIAKKINFEKFREYSKKTQLYDFHVENGGKMVNFGGKFFHLKIGWMM
jgi:hypothetical protein